MKILSVDPGLSKVAYAIWSNEHDSDLWYELEQGGLAVLAHEVGTERVQKWADMACAFREMIPAICGDYLLVIETPQVYGGPRDEDPNDLIDLAGVVGAIAATVGGPVEWSPKPREWKGQAPKEISRQRVDNRLTEAEKSRIRWPIKSLRHNVYDALHLGLVYLEREGLRKRPLPQRYPGKS